MSRAKGKTGLIMALIITTAICLRAPITSVGAILYCIVEDLNLSNTIAGSIGTIPLIVMSVFSPVVTRLSDSKGMGNGMFYGIFLMIVGILLRSFGGVSGLLVGTVIIAMGITFGNVLVPAIIKTFYPDNVGGMTGLYTTTMSICSGIGTGLSVPLAVGLGLGWRWMFCIWAVAAFICLCVAAVCIKKNPEGKLVPPQGGEIKLVPPQGKFCEQISGGKLEIAKVQEDKELVIKSNEARNPMPIDSKSPKGSVDEAISRKPIYKNSMAWALALMFAGQSLVFFTLTAWLPTIISDRGFTAEEAGMVAMVFMVAGIPANFGVPIIANKFKHIGRLAAVIAGVGTLGVALLFFANNIATFIFAAILIQLGVGGVFSLNLALYGLKTKNGAQAAQVSAFSQSVGYILAAIGPMTAGVLYDMTSSWTSTLVLCLGIMMVDIVASYIAGEGKVM